MAAEENKRILRRETEVLWIKRQVDKIDDFYSDDCSMPMNGPARGAAMKKLIADYITDPANMQTVKVDYHEMIGEGDLVAAIQTNHRSDGSTVEGITFARFKNGKIDTKWWYTPPPAR